MDSEYRRIEARADRFFRSFRRVMLGFAVLTVTAWTFAAQGALGVIVLVVVACIVYAVYTLLDYALRS